jgi:hypothetical protein
MLNCGFYTIPSYQTTLNKINVDSIKINDNTIVKNNEINQIKSYTLSFENTDNFIFIPNTNLFMLNPDEPKFKYGYFAFMMVRIVENEEEKKNDAIIGYSQNPFFSTFYHNKNSVKDKLNDKEWQLYIILGPFILKKTCINCCTDWLRKTRGINSKRIRAEELKVNYNIDLYSSNKIEEKELDKLISEILPKSFRTEYKKMKNQ